MLGDGVAFLASLPPCRLVRRHRYWRRLLSKKAAANTNETADKPKGNDAFDRLESSIQEAILACRKKLVTFREQEDSYRNTLRSTLAEIYKLRCLIRDSQNEFNTARFVVASLDDKKFKELSKLENLEIELVKGYMAPADSKDASYFSRVLKGLTAMKVGPDDAVKALNDKALRDIAKEAGSDSSVDKVTLEALQANIVAAPSLAKVSFTDKAAVVPDKPFVMLAAPTEGGGAAVKVVFDEALQKKLFDLIVAEETKAANAAKKAEKKQAKLAAEAAKSAVSLFPQAKAA